MGSWNPSRGLAVLIIVALAFAAAILVLAFLVPPIIRDVEGLAADWPHRAVSLFERLRELPIAEKLDAARLEQYLSGTAGGVFSLLKGIAGGLVGFFSWLVLTAYFILDGDRAFHWAMSLFPSHHRFRLESTFLRAEQRLRKCADGGGGTAHTSAHRGGPLSRDRPRPSEPPSGTQQRPCHFFVSTGARPDTAA